MKLGCSNHGDISVSDTYQLEYRYSADMHPQSITIKDPYRLLEVSGLFPSDVNLGGLRHGSMHVEMGAIDPTWLIYFEINNE